VLGPQLVHYAGRVPDECWGNQGRTSSGEFTFSIQLAAAKLLGGALILTGAGTPLAAEALAFRPQLKPLPRQPAGTPPWSEAGSLFTAFGSTTWGGH
jgi:hypothetical protein